MVKETPEKKPLSATERKAEERKRKRRAGLVPVEIWVHKDRKDDAKKMEKELKKPK